ncbi:MAG: NAD(P)/FAD-dependent oxidoreductase, partial [Acholeplasmataceae bacterium]|nr:NAD(P)/FAD-dependent oxidoreductase [Acholeplasmataceae bacterium]
MKTADNEKIFYDKLVLAMGSKLRHLDVKGSDAKGIFYLRNYQNALNIKRWSRNSHDVLIIGAGFIGLELASSFNQLGKNVTVVEALEKPLSRILGDEASSYFVKMHEKKGVKIITEKFVTEFINDEKGNLKAVLTKDGTKINAEMAIIGIGVIPNTTLSHPDLKVERGIIVDQYGKTSLSDIYAIGDATVWPYKGKLIHVEHWEH